jgi:hypothetical protein
LATVCVNKALVLRVVFVEVLSFYGQSSATNRLSFPSSRCTKPYSFRDKTSRQFFQFQMGTNSALLTLVAGGLSGTTVDFVLFPLDTIKTRLQARPSVVAAAGKQASFYKGTYAWLPFVRSLRSAIELCRVSLPLQDCYLLW